jgi:hypothetical protein
MKITAIATLAGAALIAFLGRLVSPPTAPASVCSLMPGYFKTDSQPYFIGLALADTVASGPGSTEAHLVEGHFGTPWERTVHGQLVSVERWGGAPPALAQVSGDTAVVVPWDYAADCSTTPWSASWRWLPPNRRLFFTPQLRAREHWVRSHPTFDAYAPQHDAYPPDYPDPVSGPAPKGLTVDQMFDLQELVPTLESITRDGWKAIDGAVEWARNHPDLAVAYPAEHIGWGLTMAAAESHVRNLQIPIAGTYLVTLTYPDSSHRSFYLRTGDRTSGAWHILRPRSDDEWGVKPWSTQLDGYEVNLWVASREAELPRTPEPRRRYMFSLGVRERADSADDFAVWRAAFETSGLYLLELLDDPQLDSLMAHHFRWLEAQWRSGSVVGDPGRFLLDSAGRVTFEQTVPLDDGRAILITAQRISLDTVEDRAW